LQTHETKGADLGSKSSIGTWFTTGGPQVDDFDFIGILASRRISPRHRPEYTKTLTNFGAIAARGLGYDRHLGEEERERECGLGRTVQRIGGSERHVGGSEPIKRKGAARSFLTEMC
jgi:hypothetical protein